MQSVSNAWKALYTKHVVPRSKVEITLAVTGETLTFTDADIIEMNIDLHADLCSFTLPSAKINIVFDNSSGIWDADNASGYYPKLDTNQILKVKIGYVISGSTEWISGGEYFLSEWKTSKKDQRATLTAVDLIQAYILPTQFNYSMLGTTWNTPADTGTLVPSTARYRELDTGYVGMLCSALGIPQESGNNRIRIAVMEHYEEWDEDQQQYIEYDFYPRIVTGGAPVNSDVNNLNCAEILQYIANSTCYDGLPDPLFMMYLTRDGYLDIKPRVATLQSYDINAFNTYSFDMERERNIKQVDYIYTVFGAYLNPRIESYTSLDADGRVFENTNPSPMQLNHNFVLTTGMSVGYNGYPVQQIGNTLINHLIVSGEFRADPRLDVGDKVTFSASGTSYSAYITDLKYKYNGMWKANFKGRIIQNGI